MDINVTLFGQMITFAIFIWFTMRFVWPPLAKALDERQAKIAEGLAAAERSQQALLEAEASVAKMLDEAKQHAAEIVEQAHKRGNSIIEESKQQAKQEGERLIGVAQGEIERSKLGARRELQQELISIAMLGAEQVLQRQIDEASNAEIFKKLVEEI